MVVMHQEFFRELGMKGQFYDKEKQSLNKELITTIIDKALDRYKDKYKSMRWNHDHISYNTLYEFGIDFSEQLCSLNLETKRD